VKRADYAVAKTLVKDAITSAVSDWKKQIENRPSVYADSLPGAAIAAGSSRLVRK
jgi:hypothetical protein